MDGKISLQSPPCLYTLIDFHTITESNRFDAAVESATGERVHCHAAWFLFLKDYEKGGGVMFIWVCLITIYMVILLLQTASFRINLWAFTLAFYSFISFSRGWCLEGKILCVLRKTLGIFLWKWNKLIYNWIRALINDKSAFL